MANGWSSVQPKTSRGSKRLSDEVDVYKFPEGKYVAIRFIGPITSFAFVWFKIISSQKKEKTAIPKICLDYNPKTESFEGNKCPYRLSGAGSVQQMYVTNIIVRELQENKKFSKKNWTSAEKKKRKMLGQEWYVKEKGSESKTPVRVMQVSSSMADDLKALADLNKVKDKKTGQTKYYDIGDPKYGRDLMVRYNPNAAGNKKWDIQLEARTPLTDEELEYLLQPLDNLESLKPQSVGEAKADLKGILPLLQDKISRKDVDDDDDSEDEDDDDDLKKKKKKNGKVSKKKNRDDDEDDDDSNNNDDDEDEDDNDDEDSDDEDSDDDDDDDSGDDEEDDDEDGDDEEDSDDEDDDEDEPKKKKKSKGKSSVKNKKKDKKKKKKSSSFDDDDDEF